MQKTKILYTYLSFTGNVSIFYLTTLLSNLTLPILLSPHHTLFTLNVSIFYLTTLLSNLTSPILLSPHHTPLHRRVRWSRDGAPDREILPGAVLQARLQPHRECWGVGLRRPFLLTYHCQVCATSCRAGGVVVVLPAAGKQMAL